MRYVSGSHASGRNAKAARSGMPMALPGGVLAAVDVGEVLERVGRGADEGEVVLAGVDDAVGGGVGVELGVAEVDHDLAPGQPAAGVDDARPGLDRVHRLLEQAGGERRVDVGDHADLDGGGGEPDVGARRRPTRPARPRRRAAVDAAEADAVLPDADPGDELQPLPADCGQRRVTRAGTRGNGACAAAAPCRSLLAITVVSSIASTVTFAAAVKPLQAAEGARTFRVKNLISKLPIIPRPLPAIKA